MKLWRTRYHDADLGLMQSWHSNRQAAQAALRSLRDEGGEPHGVEDVAIVNIDTSRPGLIAWLNTHCSRDNG